MAVFSGHGLRRQGALRRTAYIVLSNSTQRSLARRHQARPFPTGSFALGTDAQNLPDRLYGRLQPLHTARGWFWADDIYSLEITFQKALLRKGKPKRVYVDRGLSYQSNVFRTACAELGIRHISGTAYHPEGRGKLERFWQCVDNEFLLELKQDPVDTLEELNKRFWAWLDEVYHCRVNSETNATPLTRFTSIDLPPLEHPERLAEVFLWRDVRKVD